MYILRKVKTLIAFLLSTLVYWLLVFFVQRIVFSAVNSVKAVDLPVSEIAVAMLRGTVYDVSIWGYVSILACVAVAVLGNFFRIRKILAVFAIVTAVVSGLAVFLLPAEAVTYSAWGHHVSASSLMMVADRPSLIFASAETWFEIVYVVVCGLFVVITLGVLRKLIKLGYHIVGSEGHSAATWGTSIGFSLVCLVLAGLMIIPIRGGVGIAPLNTGRAYFSSNIFANHIAVNPLWNFIYSTKRAKAADTEYHFMEYAEAEKVFDGLMQSKGHSPKVFKGDRPNVVVILLESFSAHGIAYLGGANATPNIDSLIHEGIYFDNFYASADRSGKGLVAVMCGYPCLPTIRIIQYPSKTQSLPYIARHLRTAGYSSQTFIYGGDLGFNNFNSLVNMAGFDNVITEDDFSADQMGDKWGAHDEYTFERLLQRIDAQSQPFFDFFFTLSSHEPYTVPMERVMQDDYLNSMAYTDRCLGNFMREARKRPWFDNTVFVLVADHGHGGPENVGVTDRRKFNIPLIMTGGAVLPKDSLVHSYGSQTDIAATLLEQIGVPHDDFTFSKNLLDSTARDFAFFDFDDGFGYVTPTDYQVYDNQMNAFVRHDDTSAASDTVSGKAYLQIVARDTKQR